MQIRVVLNEAISELKALGYDTARLDAELLMMHVTKLNKVQLLTHDTDELNSLDEAVFKALVAQRVQGHPIAHLLGERGFWDLNLKVTPETLIPRPDTEILVEKALTLITCNKFTSVLDLGTGSGAIILALKHSAPHIEASAVDLSSGALAIAQENALRYGLEVDFYLGSWFEALNNPNQYGQYRNKNHKFNLIVSNPPYIEENDPHLHMGDVRFEPLSALTSGVDGLNAIRHIIAHAQLYLKNHGYLIIEHGYNQGEKVRALMEEANFYKVETLRDFGQNERITLACKIG